MIRVAVAFASTLVLVFSVTFVAAHWLSAEPARAPRLVAVPASPAAAPLRVRTIGRAAALPALRRSPGATSAALIADSPAPAPALSSPRATASSLRAKAAGS